MAVYKRVLLKLSGEALKTGSDLFDFDQVHRAAAVIHKMADMGTQIGIVIGAGNIWRGRQGPAANMDAVTADQMGMLGTVINCLCMADALRQAGVDAVVMSAVDMNRFCEPFNAMTARRYLSEGRVVLFAAGSGNPFFSTDTAVALRAIEMQVDAILMAKNIDGVYTADPHKDPNAVLIREVAAITPDIEALAGGAGSGQGTGGMVTKLRAARRVTQQGIPMVIANGANPLCLYDIVEGKPVGTRFLGNAQA